MPGKETSAHQLLREKTEEGKKKHKFINSWQYNYFKGHYFQQKYVGIWGCECLHLPPPLKLSRGDVLC